MNTTDISRAYQLVHQLASRGGSYSHDELSALAVSVERATPDLSRSPGDFTQTLQKAARAFDAGDDDQLAAELIRLRVGAMSVVADMDNLVDAISQLFERKSVRSL